MTVQIVAIILLILRLATLWFTGAVLLKQLKLFKMTIDSGLVKFRLSMTLLAVVFLVGSFLPIAVDVYYGFIATGATWNALLVLYATSNAISFLAASALLWKIYQIVTKGLEEEQREEDRDNG